MLGSAATIRAFSLQRWIGLPAVRARCVLHFLGIAATLAAAKVLLSTIGVTLFVAEQGAAGLPPFYLGFAAIAILLSFGLGSIIDRVSKVRLAQITFAGLLVGTAALRLLLALDVPGVSFALLASATAFEIILDIVFWVVVAVYLDAFEFRRATPLLYMALAIGGAAGGGVARVGAGFLPPADLLLLLPPLAALVVVQFGAVASRLREVPENHPDTADEADGGLSPILLGRLLKRYPLALLISLNALVVTFLYGLSEFLILSIYEARFTSEVELAEFLSLLFALMQIVEFALLYTLTRVLVERTGPLLRNLVFPLTSLGGLVFLIVSPRLLAAVVMHVNIEAVSNALFMPISNTNYVPLPLGFQGRARTLSEGIFYPIGLALAGAVLWTADPEAALLQVEFTALIFAGLFALLGVGIGFLFLPTLRANVGSGLITPSQAIASGTVSAPRIRTLLHSRESELRLLGLALAQHLDPKAFEDDLHALARRADRVTWIALARLVAAAPGQWAQGFLDLCLTGRTEQEVKLALLVMLIRRAPLKPEHLVRVLGAQSSAVVVLGHVVTEGIGAWDRIQPLIRKREVASDLVDAIVCAERTDVTRLLLACLATAEPEQQCRALVMLNGLAGPVRGTTEDLLRRLARSRSAAVRAEAIVSLSRRGPRAAALRELVAALDDPDRYVRGRVAEALCTHGDQAAALLRHRLSAVTIGTTDAVWAVARIASPQARRLLAGFIEKLQGDAQRTAHLLDGIAAWPDSARWSALELCLRDHHARVVDVVIAALSPAIEARLARRVRDDLQSADQRSRASAFELIAAMPASRLAPGGVALLHSLLFEDSAGRLFDWGSDVPGQLIAQAMESMGPWVRRAAALPTAPSSSPLPARRLMSPAGPADQDPTGDREMGLEDQELERIITLKRTPLFRYLPFETVVEVARSVQPRVYLVGEQVMADSTGRQDLLILEAGMLSIGNPEGATHLSAPACFGEVALVGERMPWPRITAVEESRVWFLGSTIFQELCHEHPEMAIELCKLLARRVCEAGETVPSCICP